MRLVGGLGIIAVVSILLSNSSVHAQDKAGSLRLDQVIELPGIQGGFDHLAFDSEMDRVFVAAADQGVVLAVGLKDMKVRTIPGFVHPHSILVQRERSRVFVTDSGDGASAFIDIQTLGIIRKLPLAFGANCLLFNPQNDRIYVTAGGDRVQQTVSTLQSVDARTAKINKSISVLALHLQPMALDVATHRLFVNVADQDLIAIYNSQTLDQIGGWRLPDGHRNSPIAIDPQRHRLFVIATDPGLLLELDSTSGNLIGSERTPRDPDDMSVGASGNRIYVPGDGFLNVYAVGKSGELRVIERLETGPGARTATLIQSERKYVVAVPASTIRPARLLVYAIHE